MLTTPCSEACLEIGLFFMEQNLFDTAILWFYNAAFETTSILNLHSQGDLPLFYLCECYRALADHLSRESISTSGEQFLSIKTQIEEYCTLADTYESKAKSFELPEEL